MIATPKHLHIAAQDTSGRFVAVAMCGRRVGRLSLVSAEDATCSKCQQKAAVKGVKRMTLTLVGDRDSLGRCFFRLDWQQDGRDRGQYFFAVPEEHISRLEADGYYVQILETGARLTVRDLADRPDLPHHDHTGVT